MIVSRRYDAHAGPQALDRLVRTQADLKRAQINAARGGEDARLRFGHARFGDHACLSLSNDIVRERWRLVAGSGRSESVNVNVSLWANNTILLRDALRQGLGLAVMPERSVRADLEAGTLVHVLPEWTLGNLSVSLQYASRDLLPGRVRAVIDFILEERRRLDGELGRSATVSPGARRRTKGAT